MTEPPPVGTAGENYLEAIFQLASRKGVARVRDIAAALSVHKSTVSSSLKSLAEKGLVNYSPYEMATLTEQGREIAEDVARRHEIIRDFFVRVLGLDPQRADANACRAEHVLDAEVFQRLADFARSVGQCPDAHRNCLNGSQARRSCTKERV